MSEGREHEDGTESLGVQNMPPKTTRMMPKKRAGVRMSAKSTTESQVRRAPRREVDAICIGALWCSWGSVKGFG